MPRLARAALEQPADASSNQIPPQRFFLPTDLGGVLNLLCYFSPAFLCAIIGSVNLALLIPAFRPGPALMDLVETIARQPYSAIVIVNDGSEREYDSLFESAALLPRVHVLRHAVNLGKGAALKTGFNFILNSFPDCVGVVTADADGQHQPGDVSKVGEALLAQPDRLILGVRRFGSDVPLRSRFGNQATRLTFFLTTGQRLSDTQTGLRGIPRKMLPTLLRLPSTGYEFELDMLLACKRQACPIQEAPIRTIYEKGNPTSHFNPLLDSLRIYFVLLRFSFLSLATALVDNLAFVLAFFTLSSILYAQIIGRLVAVLFNYPLAHGAVFLSREKRSATLPKYLLLVTASGAVSYILINFIHTDLSVGVVWAKLAAEGALFFANFALQRDFVFTQRTASPAATDWDRYYTSTPFTAKLTRKYTESVIVRALQQFGGARSMDSIVEIGGANSCFLNRIMAEFDPGTYHVVDSNQFGLDLLRRRFNGRTNIILHATDCLNLDFDLKADVVFSIGLIEHFEPAGTQRVIQAHFDLLKQGGIAIISYPTPTLLYRVARSLCEGAGLWKFPDERPLDRGEVLESLQDCGKVLFEKTLWPLVFTQHMMVVQKP